VGLLLPWTKEGCPQAVSLAARERASVEGWVPSCCPYERGCLGASHQMVQQAQAGILPGRESRPGVANSGGSRIFQPAECARARAHFWHQAAPSCQWRTLPGSSSYQGNPSFSCRAFECFGVSIDPPQSTHRPPRCLRPRSGVSAMVS
jgi:hypothetical protein